jgi:hypothetical protein
MRVENGTRACQQSHIRSLSLLPRVLMMALDWRWGETLMIMQAFVDDSGSEPQSLFFVLAGFIAPSCHWTSFSSEWQVVLSQEPRIEYFKFNEAMSLKGQFDRALGWNESKRDRKIESLIYVIVKFVQIRIHATIRNDEFKRHFLCIPSPKRHKAIENPYVLLAMQLIYAVAVWSPIRGIIEPCDFVFDEQGHYGDALRKWGAGCPL